MAGEDQAGRTPLGLLLTEVLKQPFHEGSLLGVQAGRRLVEEQQVRVAEQGLTNGQALLLSPRERGGPLTGCLKKADSVKPSVCGLPQLTDWSSRQPAGEHQLVAAAHAKQAGLLEDHSRSPRIQADYLA